jgi:Skp1 family, tetramerisation domain
MTTRRFPVVTSDGVITQVPYNFSLVSPLIMGFLDDDDYTSIDDKPIPLLEITSDTLAKILTYWHYHAGTNPVLPPCIVIPIQTTTPCRVFIPWDVEFFTSMSLQDANKIIPAANYIGYVELCWASAAYVAVVLLSTEGDVEKAHELFPDEPRPTPADLDKLRADPSRLYVYEQFPEFERELDTIKTFTHLTG